MNQVLLYFPLLLALLMGSVCAIAQTTVTGTIRDDASNETMVGATVALKGTTIGTTTDIDGKFKLNVPGNPPFKLVISFIGYTSEELEVTDPAKPITVRLAVNDITLKAFEVKELRITEKSKESAHTVESLDAQAIKETPAANFYDGLGALKGVDLTSSSIGFKIINTRGFNSTSPVRSLQLIDGVDNQSPGLNFSIGNFAGANELDVERVELIVGASSALYGPNAFNGVIDMHTKDPFVHQGFSIMTRAAERNLLETSIRFAKGFKNKAGKDKFAFKLNLSGLMADDWQANNTAATDRSLAFGIGTDNYGGYDAVNTYGDERLTAGENNFSDLFGQRNFPGLGTFHRTGYKEVDLVDYDARNAKLQSAFHYKITDKITAVYGTNYVQGTTVYQGENRYSLKGLQFQQHRVEVSQKDKFYIRSYYTAENSGQTYDAVFTAFRMQEASKDNAIWQQDYSTYWIKNIRPKVWALPDFPNPNNPAFTSGWFADSTEIPPNYALAQAVYAANPDSMVLWHQQARAYADSIGNLPTNKPYYRPGTAAYDSLFNDVTGRTFTEGGTQFYSRSKLIHTEAGYTFTPKWAKINTGGSFRQYRPDSRGTFLSDTGNTVIVNNAIGAFLGVEKRVLDSTLILTATVRVDKNQNFSYLASPAASMVYKYKDNHYFRGSFASAIRNPTLLDQYLLYNVGRAILIGNLNGVDSLVTVDSFIDYFSGLNRDTLSYFNVAAIKPEQVRTVEVGYKGVLFNKSLFVDVSYYFSWYKDFLGFKLGAAVEFDSLGVFRHSQFYRVSANSTQTVTTQGVSVGGSYFWREYSFTGNWSWNVLNTAVTDEIIPAYNTPEHKVNLGVSGRKITLLKKFKPFGFGINYKWVQGFLFEGSPQFTGRIDSYDLLDVQLNYEYTRWHTTLKLGASNVLNNEHYEVYGGPLIGRMAYISALFELDFK